MTKRTSVVTALLVLLVLIGTWAMHTHHEIVEGAVAAFLLPLGLYQLMYLAASRAVCEGKRTKS